MTDHLSSSGAEGGTITPAEGDWVVSLDVELAGGGSTGELAVRALAAAAAGTRTYVVPRASGYSFTVIFATVGAEAALARALTMLASAQDRAGLVAGSVVCAEVTLVGTRPVPAASVPPPGCENPAS